MGANCLLNNTVFHKSMLYNPSKPEAGVGVRGQGWGRTAKVTTLRFPQIYALKLYPTVPEGGVSGTGGGRGESHPNVPQGGWLREARGGGGGDGSESPGQQHPRPILPPANRPLHYYHILTYRRAGE